MSINFTEAEIPQVTRTTNVEPNPFDGVFPRDDKAIVVTVDAAPDSKEVGKMKRHAYNAAKAVDRTCRIVARGTGTAKSPKTELTMWTVKRREYKARNGEDATPE